MPKQTRTVVLSRFELFAFAAAGMEISVPDAYATLEDTWRSLTNTTHE